MSDPLSLLRQFIIEKKEIIEMDNLVIFDNLGYSKTTETNYLIWRPHNAGFSEITHYILETLLFLIKNAHLKHLEYAQLAINQIISCVMVPDKEDLLMYLNGKNSTSKNLDPNFKCKPPILVKIVKSDNFEILHSFDPNLKPQNQSEIFTNFDPTPMPATDETLIKTQQPAESDIVRRIQFNSNTIARKNAKTIKKTRAKKPTVPKPKFNGLNRTDRNLKQMSKLPEVKSASTKPKTCENIERIPLNIEGIGHLTPLTPVKVEDIESEYKELSETNILTPLLHLVEHRLMTPEVPIIIVPASSKSFVTLHNVKEILQDWNFVSANKKKQQTLENCDEVVIFRTRDEEMIPYLVVDDVSKLGCGDWTRVVAVFVHGPVSQFKKWPWNGNPEEILANLKGFHLKWENSRLDSNVQKWNVDVFELNRWKRDLDYDTLQLLWEVMESHIEQNKCNLYF